MGKSKGKPEGDNTKNELKLDIICDFAEFGRITKEDLNDFFDNDVMSSLTASAKRRIDRD